MSEQPTGLTRPHHAVSYARVLHAHLDAYLLEMAELSFDLDSDTFLFSQVADQLHTNAWSYLAEHCPQAARACTAWTKADIDFAFEFVQSAIRESGNSNTVSIAYPNK